MSAQYFQFSLFSYSARVWPKMLIIPSYGFGLIFSSCAASSAVYVSDTSCTFGICRNDAPIARNPVMITAV